MYLTINDEEGLQRSGEVRLVGGCYKSKVLNVWCEDGGINQTDLAGSACTVMLTDISINDIPMYLYSVLA